MPVHTVPQNSSSSTTEVDNARVALPSTRERIVLQPGAEVAIGARHYRISQILDLETVLAHDCQSGEPRQCKVSELAPVLLPAELAQPTEAEDLVGIADAAWHVAQERFAVIRPLLTVPHCTLAHVGERAHAAGVHIVTVYRCLRRYQRSGRLSARLFSSVLGADDASFCPVMGTRGEACPATGAAATGAAASTPSRGARASRERVGAAPRVRRVLNNAGSRT